MRAIGDSTAEVALKEISRIANADDETPAGAVPPARRVTARAEHPASSEF